MRSTRMFTTLTLATGLLAGAAVARAEEPGNGPAAADPSVHASARAGEAIDAATQARLDGLKHRITDQSAKVSASSRARADARLTASARDIDAHASGDAGSQVASRLSNEFGMTTDALLAEKTELNASWGDLTIAHALAGQATDVTVADLMALKQDGMGWGQIAAGLGLKLGTVVSGVKSESQVASGAAKAGAMRGATARANAGANAQAGVGKGVAAGARVDAGVKVGKIKP